MTTAVTCSNGTWKQRMARMELAPCRQPFWARGGHPQTIIAHLLPSPSPQITGQQHIIPLPDGDQLTASYYVGHSDEVMLYLFHGLGGHIDSDYIRRMTRIGLERGYHVMAVNHRGCGSGDGLAVHPYHSGRAEDLSAVIQYGRDKHPQKRHIAIGFSLSGNALLLLQAGYRGQVQPDLGISVNAPIRLDKAALAIKTGLNRIYDLRFVRKCQKAVRDRYEKGLIQTQYKFPIFNTLYGFDQIYTAPAGGFKDRYHYYDSCSAAPYLEKIKSPTVVLTSRDDPMVDVKNYETAKYAPDVWLHIEKHGGHMGYLTNEQTPLGGNRWLDYALDGFIKAWLGNS